MSKVSPVWLFSIPEEAGEATEINVTKICNVVEQIYHTHFISEQMFSFKNWIPILVRLG